MSSLTTTGSGTEKSLEMEELVDTRLSLTIGSWSRPPPPVKALPPLTENEVSAGRKWKKGSENGEGVATTRQNNKRARTMQGGSDVDDDGGVAANHSATKKLRLTADQATLLGKSFRAHNVLSHVRPCDHAHT